MPKVIDIDETTFEYLDVLCTKYGWENFMVGGSLSLCATGALNRRVNDLDIIVVRQHPGCSSIFKHFIMGKHKKPGDVESEIKEIGSYRGEYSYQECEVNETEHKKFKVSIAKPKQKNGFMGKWGLGKLKPKIIDVCVFAYRGKADKSVIPIQIQSKESGKTLNVLLDHPRSAIKAKEVYIDTIDEIASSGERFSSKLVESRIKHYDDILSFKRYESACKLDFTKRCLSYLVVGGWTEVHGEKISDIYDRISDKCLPKELSRMDKIQLNRLMRTFKEENPAKYNEFYKNEVTDLGFGVATFNRHKGILNN